MAKKKAKKTVPAGRPVVLRYISDPGHGWVEVPTALCKKLGLGADYPKRGKYCYLEEDAEATDLDRALKKHKVHATFAGHDTEDFEAWLGGETWPYIPACIYGDDVDLAVHAMESMATQMKQLYQDDTYSASERSVWLKQMNDYQQMALMFSTMRGGE